ncbi:killer cell lectin-like receptor subfamily F member 1 isoform 1-T1 [Guaruba guarouba]
MQARSGKQQLRKCNSVGCGISTLTPNFLRFCLFLSDSLSRGDECQTAGEMLVRCTSLCYGWQHRRSAWLYVALVLGALVLVLLGVITVLAKQFLRCRAGKSESLSHIGVNSTGNHTSSEKTALAVLLKWLMEELCEDGQGKICELCPPGWQLHRSRCYYFSEEAVSWDDSQKNCLARKSQLLVIEDEIEMEFIDNKEKDTKYIWIGLIPEMKKQWSSVEDPGVKENRKAINRIETDKNCAVYRRKNIIQVDNCQTLKKWICKKNATLLVL